MTISSTTNIAINAAEYSATKSQPLNDDSMDFYNLLTTQLTNQNPLEPVSETDFLGQMAQFSTVEKLDNLNAGMSESNSQQKWLEAQSFLGRKVQWTGLDGAAELSGKVDRIMRDAESEIWLEVNGSKVALDSVTVVSPTE